MSTRSMLWRSWIWIFICIMVFGFETIIEGKPMDNLNDIFNNISNRTEDIYKQTVNFTEQTYDTAANRTKEIVEIIRDHKIGSKLNEIETFTNCSIVLGGALTGAVVIPVAIAIGIPLVLCILGFTCFGIMAGSAAACCQSSIGDVPAGSCFACLQSTGAGGGRVYIVVIAIVGVPIGLALGGYITNAFYYNCV